MIGSAARSTLRYPLRCTSSTAVQSSSLPSAKPLGRLIPATLTTASREPNSSTSSANSASTAVASVTDVFDARARPPAATMRSAVVGSALASRRADPSSVTPGSTVTTNAPLRATSSAIAAPIPAAPPVTTTTRVVSGTAPPLVARIGR
jgi:hypothetical protein